MKERRKGLNKPLIELMNREEKERELRRSIKNLRSNISKGLKSWAGEIEDYREKVEGYRDKLKGVNISQLTDKELSALQKNVSNMANWAKRSSYEETLQKRVSGLMDYLESSETKFDIINVPKAHKMEISTDTNTYTMSYKEVSDFWKMFRDLYEADAVQNLRNYDKGMAGVSTVLNLYQGRNIKDFNELKELLEARYTLEKHEDMIREQEATKDIRKGIKMLR